MNLFGVLPAADASFVMAPAGPITGHVDLATFNVDTTASFNVKLAKLTPHGTDVNLVGDTSHHHSEPVTVRMQGVVNPAAGGTFASTYSIPSFQDCQLLTEVITAFVVGSGEHVHRQLRPARVAGAGAERADSAPRLRRSRRSTCRVR